MKVVLINWALFLLFSVWKNEILILQIRLFLSPKLQVNIKAPVRLERTYSFVQGLCTVLLYNVL